MCPSHSSSRRNGIYLYKPLSREGGEGAHEGGKKNLTSQTTRISLQSDVVVVMFVYSELGFLEGNHLWLIFCNFLRIAGHLKHVKLVACIADTFP